MYVPRVMGAAWQMLVDGQPVANNLDDGTQNDLIENYINRVGAGS